MYQAYRDMYEALGVKDIDLLLKKPQPPAPMDGYGKFDGFIRNSVQSILDKIIKHTWTRIYRLWASINCTNKPKVLGLLQKNILEHIALMGQEQVELEFVEEMAEIQMMGQKMQQMTTQMGVNPQVMQQNPEFVQLQQENTRATAQNGGQKVTINR